MADTDDTGDDQAPAAPPSQGSAQISPDEEARTAFATSTASAQQRGQVQGAFDTQRQRMAFVSGLMAGGQKAQRASRAASLGRGLEGAAPSPGG